MLSLELLGEDLACMLTGRRCIPQLQLQPQLQLLPQQLLLQPLQPLQPLQLPQPLQQPQQPQPRQWFNTAGKLIDKEQGAPTIAKEVVSARNLACRYKIKKIRSNIIIKSGTFFQTCKSDSQYNGADINVGSGSCYCWKGMTGMSHASSFEAILFTDTNCT